MQVLTPEELAEFYRKLDERELEGRLTSEEQRMEHELAAQRQELEEIRRRHAEERELQRRHHEQFMEEVRQDYEQHWPSSSSRMTSCSGRRSSSMPSPRRIG